MSFRKLQYKNVNATRSTQVIGAGEVAVDPNTNSLYIGDGSTVGGNPVKSVPTYGPIQTISAQISEDNLNPTELSLDYQVHILTAFNSNAQYASVPDGTATGQVLIVKTNNGGAAGAATNISGTGFTINLNSADSYAVTLLWDGSAWQIIGTSTAE